MNKSLIKIALVTVITSLTALSSHADQISIKSFFDGSKYICRQQDENGNLSEKGVVYKLYDHWFTKTLTAKIVKNDLGIKLLPEVLDASPVEQKRIEMVSFLDGLLVTSVKETGYNDTEVNLSLDNIEIRNQALSHIFTMTMKFTTQDSKLVLQMGLLDTGIQGGSPENGFVAANILTCEKIVNQKAK